MGRTKRRRQRRKSKTVFSYMHSDVGTINFIKWMTINGWIDTCKLRIAEFPNTGRGVLSLKKIKHNDLLTEVPLHLMITYKTLEESILLHLYVKNLKSLLSIHEMLAIFLVLEYHLGHSSIWFKYLSYLPDQQTITIPWFCSDEEMFCLPADLRTCIEECKHNLEESWNRVILKSACICPHCNEDISNILKKTVYNWAYTIVNSRSVYIDPKEIRKMTGKSLDKFLSDEPTMALCPYIDMFNHSSIATVKAILRPDGPVPKYCLITENNFETYEEIFISYGAHDNKKLLCQYGFILPENQFDTIEFDLKEIINVCKLNVSSRQYKFLCDHGFNSDINVNNVKFSFNMAAVLYVLTHSNDLDWSLRVYTSVFTKAQLKLMYGLAEILLKWKLKEYEKDLENAKTKALNCSRHFKTCLEYLKYRTDFIKNLVHVDHVK